MRAPTSWGAGLVCSISPRRTRAVMPTSITTASVRTLRTSRRLADSRMPSISSEGTTGGLLDTLGGARYVARNHWHKPSYARRDGRRDVAFPLFGAELMMVSRRRWCLLAMIVAAGAAVPALVSRAAL